MEWPEEQGKSKKMDCEEMIFTIHFLFKRFLCLQPCQILVECRIRDIHTAGAQDFRRCLCGKRSDCKRHRNAVVEAAVDLGAVERFSALNDHAVVRAFQGNTHRGEFVYHDIKTVRFFDFQLLRIPDHGCTVRCGGKNRDDRDFIDQGRDQFALDDSAGKRRRIAHEKVCNRFSAGVLLIQKCDVSTHGAADAEHTVAGRVDADIFQEHLRAWNYQRGGDEVGGGGNISRHTDEISMEIRVRQNRCGQPFGGNVGAEEFQRQPVWFLERAGSVTLVFPSAYSPASRTHDLTCADATGER